MPRSMPMLHPHIPPGPFDLGELLEFEPPVRWRPEEGDRVQGELVKIDERVAFKVKAPTLFILMPPSPDDVHEHEYVVVRAGGVVLRGAVKDLDPQPGDEVAIKYEGKRPTQSGEREYAYHRMAARTPGGKWRIAE